MSATNQSGQAGQFTPILSTMKKLTTESLQNDEKCQCQVSPIQTPPPNVTITPTPAFDKFVIDGTGESNSMGVPTLNTVAKSTTLTPSYDNSCDMKHGAYRMFTPNLIGGNNSTTSYSSFPCLIQASLPLPKSYVAGGSQSLSLDIFDKNSTTEFVCADAVVNGGQAEDEHEHEQATKKRSYDKMEESYEIEKPVPPSKKCLLEQQQAEQTADKAEPESAPVEPVDYEPVDYEPESESENMKEMAKQTAKPNDKPDDRECELVENLNCFEMDEDNSPVHILGVTRRTELGKLLADYLVAYNTMNAEKNLNKKEIVFPASCLYHALNWNRCLLSPDVIKMVIGNNGCYLKRTTENQGCYYIWHRKNQRKVMLGTRGFYKYEAYDTFDIFGADENSILQARREIVKRIYNKMKEIMKVDYEARLNGHKYQYRLKNEEVRWIETCEYENYIGLWDEFL